MILYIKRYLIFFFCFFAILINVYKYAILLQFDFYSYIFTEQWALSGKR